MADNRYTKIDELLVKYIAGEADASEKLQVEDWLKESEENRLHVEHFKWLWDNSGKLNGRNTADEEAAWSRFRERIQKNYAEPALSKRNLYWLKFAAVLLLVLGVTLLTRYFTGNSDGTRSVFTGSETSRAGLVRSVTGAETKIDTLADGSVVKLAPHSGLGYPRTFSGNKRYTELQGEAFFDIVHESQRPFVIKANDLLISVLGTSFNVKTTGDSTEVIVISGSVGVEKGKSLVRLNAGERITSSVKDTFLAKSTALANTLFNGKVVAYASKGTIPDSALDFKKHPGLLQKLLKDPAKWGVILKSYHARNDDIGVRRAVVRSVITEIERENLLGEAPVKTFRLNENEFFINEQRQPDAVQRRFKDMFLKEPGYRIYLSDIPKRGRGVFLSPDSL